MSRLLPLALAALIAQQAAPGSPIRTADKTGHVSNYDEAKVGTFTLPDPLVRADGKPVRDAADWTKQRRAEVIRMYEKDIFGRIPATTPKVAWTASAAENAGGALVTRSV